MESSIAEISIVSYEMALKKVGAQVPDSELSSPEFRRLVAQGSILVVIAGIVSWLIAV